MSQGTAVGTIYQQALEDYVPLLERPLPEPSLETGKLLKQFHPDYIDSSRTRLETGVNRGDSCHVQLAQILQSDSRINEADLAGAATINTDVLVIGGGGAGCAAALIAQQQGAHVILATKLRLGDSNTVM
ncbi:MAG: FAD-binding protein, partial [Gammaproteobacteria bacterium]|nr:FAD-binding protein [Gammaproteobacteria bacterium]MBT7329391.1 FAD-binding protein [Gammaproteobacteria bacterium]